MPPLSAGGRRSARMRNAAILLGGLTLAACDAPRDRAAADAAVVSIPDAAIPSQTPPPSPSSSTSPRSSLPNGDPRAAGVACKIMSAEGGPSATADASRWIDLPARASFTVRTIETGRELRFEGPGRIRACGDDVPLVAEGSAVGLPGSGEGPGAEQWAATACGVVRWASGVHRFTGARDVCKLQSSVGVAQLWLADDVQLEDVPVDAGAPEAGAPATSPAPAATGPASASASARDAGHDPSASPSPWHRIDAKRAVRLRGRGPLDTASAVKSGLVACEKAATEVHLLGTRMTASDAGSDNLGELAARSVVARGAARAACAVAGVRVALAGSRAEDQARLDAAVSRWRAPR